MHDKSNRIEISPSGKGGGGGGRRGKKQKCGAVVTDTGWMAVERCRYSPRQYLGYTAVRYPELSGNVARSDAAVRQLDDPLPHYIR